MNILFYMPLPEYGGVRTVTERLAAELQQRGNSVSLLMHKRFYGDERDYPNGIASYYLPSEILMDEKNISFYHNLINTLKIDVVVNQDALYDSINLIDTVKELGVPVISVLHSNPMRQYKWLFKDIATLRNGSFKEKLKRVARVILYPREKRRLYRSIEGHFNRLQAGGSYVCVLSPRYKDIVRQINNKIVEICAISNPNTYIDTKSVEKEKIILFVGRLDNRSKKIQYLLDIWQSVSQLAQDWKLVIVGEGRDEAMLKKRAAKLKNVEFCGYQNPTSYYERASILCMTSIFEGFPMALTEAMQHGCVPIAFDSFAAVYDIITPGVDGEIVKSFDKREYVKKLTMLIKCDEYRSRLATAAKSNVTRYDIGNIIEQWDALLKCVNIKQKNKDK